ncbi:MAG: murein biosynthesis integral membrane protein MurJ, partial [Gammaproteobacteria bacterium]|nr:murein biosynthesis integral membrane protein MurJ [Gammaproteobacteria bacterium]
MSGEGKRRFSLMRSGALISALTFVSRIFGFIRDQLMAITFGAGGLMDAFYLAFALPNFFRRIFGEGAFSQAFVPVFNDVKEQSSHQRLRELCASVSGTLAVFVFGLAVLGVIFAEPILSVVAPGLSATPEREHAAAIMLRWTFPYLAFISLVAYAGGVLNSYGKFGVPAFTPVLLNICLIGAIFLSVYYDGPGEYVLAVGVFVAGFAQLALQLPALSKLGLLPMPTLDFKDQGVRRILVLMAPAIFGASVYQVNMLFSRFIASFLPDGSFSWLYNADRLVEFPLGIFGVALATVVLPVLSRQNSAGDQAGRT